MGRNRVVPLPPDGVVYQSQGVHLRLGDVNTRGIGALVPLGPDRQLVGVLVCPINSTMVSKVVSGCPRQFMLRKLNRRCSIEFLWLVPGGKWLTWIVRPLAVAKRWSATFHSRARAAWLPPPSATIEVVGARVPLWIPTLSDRDRSGLSHGR